MMYGRSKILSIKDITNFSVAVPIGNEINTQVTFNLTADAGDYMQLMADLDDGDIDYFSIRFHDNMPLVNHTFTALGKYDVFFDILNALGMTSLVKHIFIAVPVFNTSVTYNHSEVGVLNQLNLTVNGGTHVTVTALWEDGFASEVKVCNGSDIPGTFSHTYTVPGTWNVLVYVYNPMDTILHNLTIGSDYRITDLALDFNPLATRGSVTTFTRTLTTGSQMTCELDFGDESAVNTTYEYAPEKTGFILEHNYTSLGDYKFNYTCWNFMDVVTLEDTVFLHDAIVGVRGVNIVEGRGYVIDTQPFIGHWEFDDGFPAYFNVSIGGVQPNDSAVRYSPNQGNATWHPETFLPGDYTFRLWATNSLTDTIVDYNISLDRVVVDVVSSIFMTTEPSYVATGRNITVHVTQTDGSRVNDVITFGESAFSYYYPENHNGTFPRNDTVFFTDPGLTTVLVVVSNTVSNHSDTHVVTAEVPLDNVTLHVTCPCIGAKVITFELVMSPGPHVPNEVTVDIDFGDGSSPFSGPMVMTGGNGSEGTWSITHTYTYHTVYIANITASNHVSDLNYINHIVDVAEQLSNQVTTIPFATLHGEVTNVEISADSGTNITMTLDWDDGSDVVSKYYETAAALSAVIESHTYADVGTYNLTVNVSNSKATYITHREVKVDILITNYSRDAIYVTTLGNLNQVNLSVVTGTQMTVLFDPGEDGGTVYQTCPLTQGDMAPLSHTFTDLGVYRAWVFVSNSLNNVSDQFLLAVNEPLADYTFTGPPGANFTGQPLPATFTRTLTAGSHVTCFICFGDGDCVVSREVTASHVVTYNHSYTQMGEYVVTSHCHNFISSESTSAIFYIQSALTNYTWLPDVTWVLTSPVARVLTWSIASGTDVLVSVTYEPLRTNVSAFVTWDGLAGTLELPYPAYDIGQHVVNVTVYNGISKAVNVFKASSDAQLADVVLEFPGPHVTADIEYFINLTATSGTSVLVDIDFGDGNSTQHSFTNAQETCPTDGSFTRVACGGDNTTQADCEAASCCWEDSALPNCYLPDIVTGEWNLTVPYTFTTPGTYTARVVVSNSVSSVVRAPDTYIVEYPILEADFKLVEEDPTVNFTLGLCLLADPVPTDAKVDVDFGDGTPLITEPLMVALNACHLITHLLPTYNDSYNATVTIYNKVSRIVFTNELYPEAPLVNPLVVISGPLNPGEVHHVTVSWEAAHQVSLVVDYGDGTPVETYLVRTLSEMPALNHTYTTIASKTATFTLSNRLDEVVFKHIADIDIDIENVTLDITHVRDVASGTRDPAEFDIQATAGSRVHILITDSAGNAVYQVLTTADDLAPITIPYTDPSRTIHTGTVEIFNTRSYISKDFEVFIEKGFEDLVLEVSKLAVTFPTEALVFWFTGGGGGASAECDMGNGHVDTFLLEGVNNTYNYTYPEVGIYNWTLTLTNTIDSRSWTGTVYVQAVVEGLQADGDFSFAYGGTITVNFTWTAGTHPQFSSHLGSTELEPMDDKDNKTGFVQIAEEDYSVGTHIMKVNLSNFVSYLEVNLTIDIDHTITDLVLTATPEYTPVNGSICIQSVIPAGTRMTWVFDYGDSTTVETAGDTSEVVSQEHTSTLCHNYTFPGYLIASVNVSNTVSMVVATVAVGVEYPIDTAKTYGLSPSIVDRVSQSFTISIGSLDTFPPTGTEINVDWGDGSTDNNIPVDLTSVNPHDIAHAFSEYNTFDVTAVFFNNITSTTLNFPIQCGRDISGLSLRTLNEACVKHDDSVIFEVHVDNGSNVNYTINYDDGTPVESILRQDPGDWALADTSTFTHVYGKSGYFTPVLVASNAFGSETVTLAHAMKLEYTIAGTVIFPIDPISHPPGTTLFTIGVNNSVDSSPTDATCDFRYGDGQTETVAASFNSAKKFVHTYSYNSHISPPGFYYPTVNCSNCVSKEDYNTTVWLQEPIAHIRITVLEQCLTAPGVGTFDLEIVNGSHLYITVHFGDGTINNTMYFETAPDLKITMSHLYQDGNFTVTVTARNDIKEQTTNSPTKFISQDPIPDLIITSNSPVVYPPGRGVFTINVDSADQAPTDMFCRWTYFEGDSDHVTFAGPLHEGIAHEAIAVYTYSHVGAQVVTVNCSNCISWKNYSLSIEVSEAIQGFDVDVSHRYAEVGTVVTFTFTVTHGSNISAEIFYGDGEPSSSADFPTFIGNQEALVFTHNYSVPGYFTPNFTIWNGAGTFNLPQPAGSVEIGIEYPLIDMGLAAYNRTRPAEEVIFNVTQLQAIEPTGVHINWTYNDGNRFEERLSLSGDGVPVHQHHYNYTDYGLYHVTADLRNNISSLTRDLTLRVGVVIVNLTYYVSPPSVMVDFQPARFYIKIDEGSAVKYVITFGDGTQSPATMRHDTGWLQPTTNVISHTYTRPGDYTVRLIATNTFDTIVQTLEHRVNVEHRINTMEVTELSTHPMPPGDVYFVIEKDANDPAPTDAYCNFHYGDGEIDSDVPMTYVGIKFTHHHQYQGIAPGPRTVVIICSNSVSTKTYRITVMLHEPISVITGDVVTKCIPAPSEGEIWSNITSGSHINYTVDFGDGFINETYITYPPKVNESLHFMHIYQVGNYTVTVNMSNDISSQHLVIPTEFVVQYILTPITITTNSPVTYRPGIAEVQVRQTDPSLPPPTDVFCKWQFYYSDAFYTNYLGPTFQNQLVHTEYHTYPYSQLGRQQLRVNCSNCVSYQYSETNYIRIDENITGFVVLNSSMFVKNTDTVTWTYSMFEGTNIEALLQVGDETMTRIWPEFYAKNAAVVFKKVGFNEAGNYSLLFKVSNTVSESVISPTKKLVVQRVMTPFSVTASEVAPCPPCTVDFTIELVSRRSPGTDPFIFWTSYDDGSAWVTYSESLNQSLPHTESRTFGYDMVGEHVINVKVKNKISELPSSVSILLQVVVEEPVLEALNTSIQVGAVAWFRIRLGNGSHVNFTIDYKDGSSGTYAHPNLLNSTAPFLFSHQFTQRGNFSITAAACNKVGCKGVTANRVTIVQTPVSAFDLSGTHYVAIPDGLSVYNFTVPQDLPPPDNVFFGCDFGDDTNRTTYNEDFRQDRSYIITHNFDGLRLGSIETKCNASNLVNWTMLSFNIYIVRQIEAPNINITTKFLPVNSVARSSAWVEIGSDITYTVMYGDGTSQACFKRNHTFPCEFAHAFTESGNFTVNVTAQNPVSKLTKQSPERFIVQEVIDVDNLFFIYEEHIANPTGTFRWSLAVVGGRPAPSDVHMRIAYDDGNEEEFYIPSFPFERTHRYSSDPEDGQIGDKNIQLNLTNIVSNATMSYMMQLQEPVSSVAIKNEPFATVGGNTTITAVFASGSHLKVRVKFGDETQDSVAIDGLVRIVNFTHVYTTAGVYNLTLLYKNDITQNDVNKLQAVEAQIPVENFEVVVKSPVRLAGNISRPNEYANIQIVKDPDMPVPSNTKITVDFGDGQQSSEIAQIDPQFVVQHLYRTPGVFDIQVTVENGVSSMTLNTSAAAQLEVLGCRFTATSTKSLAVPPYRFPVMTEVILTAYTTSGTNVSFEWTPEEEDVVSWVSNTTDTAHTFTKVGTLTVQLECRNDVSRQVVRQNLQIFSPLGISWVAYEQAVKVNTNVSFGIGLTTPMKDICFSYKFNTANSSFHIWRGTSKEICSADEAFAEEHFEPVVYTDNTYYAYNLFTEVHNYNITFTAFNTLANSTMILPMSITAVACNSPIVSARVGTSVNNTLKYKRAQEFTITSSQFNITKNCKETDIYINKWEVSIYDAGQWVLATDIINPLGTGDEVKSFLIRKQTLPYGLFAFRFSMHPKLFQDSVGFSNMYVQIEGTLMTTCINNISRETVGSSQEYAVSTDGCTLDPDNDPRPFGYEWYCGRKSEMMDKTTKELDHLLIKLAVGTPETELDQKQPGCFGDGPGRLDVDGRSNALRFNTSWMAPNDTYMILVRVSKGERVVIESLLLTVNQGDPPKITISCDASSGNCLRNGQKVNRDKPLQLTMTCDNCPEGVVPTLDTKLARNGKAIDLAPESTSLSLLSDGRTLVLSLSLMNLTNPGWYEVEVSIQLAGAPAGFSSFRFAINREPHGGSVRVIPDETAPLQPVTVEISGWQDDGDAVETVDLEESARRRRRRDVSSDNHPDLTFTFIYIVKDVETQFYTSTPIIPEGDPDNDYLVIVRVIVQDAYGSATNHSTEVKCEKIVYDDPELAAQAEKEEEERLDSILNTDLTQSTDVLGDLSNVITAVNMVADVGPGTDITEVGGEEDADSAEQARLNAIAEQRRLEAIMDGLVALASAKSTDPGTIQATFEAYAAVAKKQSGEASFAMKSNSLSLMSSFSDKIGDDPEPEQILSFVATVGDALFGVLGDAVDPPALSPEDPAPEDENEADLVAKEAKKAEAEKTVAKEAAGVIENTIRNVWSASTKLMEQNGGVMVIETPLLNMTFSKTNGSKFFLLARLKRNPFSWDISSKDVTDPVTMLDMVDEDGKPTSFEGIPLPIEVKLDHGVDNWVNMDNATVDQESSLVYFYIPGLVDLSALVFELRVPSATRQRRATEAGGHLYFQLFFTFGARDVLMDRPNTTRGSYDWIKELPDLSSPNPWVVVIPETRVKPPGTYVGILPRVRNSSVLFNQSGLPAFNMRSSLPRCRSWDNTEEIWSGKVCKVKQDSTVDNTVCTCGELNREVRTYSGGISVPKVNTIDFSAVFANFAALLLANKVTLATTLTVFTLYILLLIWARKADRRDQEKWTVTPLVDNPLGAPHLYKVSVYTGLRQGAGTTSKVCFILSGEDGDTGVRIMDDGRGKGFRRGTLHHFLLTTDQAMGDLTFIRVWHDNSGGGLMASWFLDKVVIDDLHNKQRYFFLCGRWLAVAEDDGQVDRVIPPAAREEIDSFNHIFFSQTRHKMTDDHLWVSILSRPTRSTFTRAQRLTCCLTLLCTTMVANAMWYGTVEATENDTVIRIGPIILSVATLLVSIFSSLTVVPINVLLVQLFRRSRPRHVHTELPDGTHLQPSNNVTQDDYAQKRKYVDGKPKEEPATTQPKPPPEEGATPKKKQKKYWFPWWCTILAWVLALLSSLVSFFFVILYTLQWGLTKSEEWLSALLMAFLQSVIIIQPLKVIVVAMALSIIFKKFDDEGDDEVPVVAAQEEGVPDEYDEVMNIDRRMMSNAPMMPTKRKLEKARRQREHEKKMLSIIVEVFTYFLFLTLVAFIAWGTKDDTRFVHSDYLNRLMAGRTPRNQSESVWKVNDAPKMWEYLNKTVPIALYNVRDYTDMLTKRRDRAFISDGVNLRVGAVRLRQLRVQPAGCVPSDLVKSMVIECNVGYNMFDEEDQNYTVFWDWLPPNSSAPSGEVEAAFRYHSVFELNGLPTWGYMATYGGGGYIADLGTSPKKARRVLQGLMDANWVDYYTRAVILEFTVYNANANLFATVAYLLEFPPTGAVLPMKIIRSFPVYTVFSPMGTMVLIAQILYILILIYFIVRESRKLYKQTAQEYFSDAWNVFEVVVIASSVVGVGMFGAGEAAGRLVTKEIHEDKDGNTHYTRLSTYEETLTAVIGIVVFLSNLRFLRLLRFNDHVNDLINVFITSGRELLYFGVTFCIVFFAFAMPAVIFFGSYMYSFSNILRSVAGTFSIILGKMKWYDMMTASPVIAPIFFISLMILVYFVLLNMSVSILNSGYEIVRLHPDRQKKSEYQVLAFIGSKISLLFGCSKVETDTGKDYVDSLDTLDNRLDHINKMINTYYRENIKMKNVKKEEKKEDPNMKKNTWFWDNMVHF